MHGKEMAAQDLQSQLRSLLGHDQVVVRPYGQHLQILIRSEPKPIIIARLTPISTTGNYTAAFRNHAGKHEPLPGQGDISTMADLIVTLLAPYLDPNIY